MTLGCLVLSLFWASVTMASDSESDVHNELMDRVRRLVLSIEDHWARDQNGRAPSPGKRPLSMPATLAKKRHCIASRQAALAHHIFGNAAGGVSEPESEQEHCSGTATVTCDSLGNRASEVVACAVSSSPFVVDVGDSYVCSSIGVYFPLCVPSPNQTPTAALATAIAEDAPVAFFGVDAQQQCKRLPRAGGLRCIGSGSGTRRKKQHDINGAPPSEWFEAADSDFVFEAVSAFDASGAPRDLTLFDFFSGRGEASKVFQAANYSSASFDIATDRRCDLTTCAGFSLALSLVLSLKVRGLIMAGPPCCLWKLLSSSVHKRKQNRPEGDETRLCVRMANLIVRNLAVLLKLATDRGVFWVIEQPSTSQMWFYQPLQQCLVACKAFRVYTWMGCFGHDLMKASVLWGTLPTLSLLGRTRSQCPLLQAGSNGGAVYYIRDQDGSVRGGPDLFKSVAYTTGFCTALLDAWYLCK